MDRLLGRGVTINRTPPITRRRRGIVHLKTSDFAARAHWIDIRTVDLCRTLRRQKDVLTDRKCDHHIVRPVDPKNNRSLFVLGNSVVEFGPYVSGEFDVAVSS